MEATVIMGQIQQNQKWWVCPWYQIGHQTDVIMYHAVCLQYAWRRSNPHRHDNDNRHRNHHDNDNEPSRRTCDWDLTRVVQTVRQERRLSGGICIIYHHCFQFLKLLWYQQSPYYLTSAIFLFFSCVLKTVYFQGEPLMGHQFATLADFMKNSTMWVIVHTLPSSCCCLLFL